MTLTLSAHACERLDGIRTELVGDELQLFNTRVENLQRLNVKVDTAIQVLTLSRHLGETAADYNNRDHQNGNEIWAVVRSGSVETILRRRSNQPATAAAMRVRIACKYDYALTKFHP